MTDYRTDATSSLRETVERLQRFCSSQAELEWLPNHKELSEQLGCSRSAVVSAIHVLVKRGFLVKTPHGTKRISAKPQPRKKRWRILAESIEKDILSGERKAGEYLPKKSYFASKFHMSNSTILEAFQHCEQQGLLHKKGRSWVIGRDTGKATDGNPPVIVILENRIGRFHSMSTVRTRRFSPSFQEEARKCGVRLTFALAAGPTAPSGILPRGKEELMSLVSRLGYRYRGTLIVATGSEFEEMTDYVSLLGSAGQPVVWLDIHDLGVKAPIRSRQFYRAHFSEDAALVSALRYLVEYGHRTIGFGYNPRVPWQVSRYTKMIGLVRRKNLPLKIVTYPGRKTFWESITGGSVERNVERLLRNGAPLLADSLSWLVHHIDNFYEALEELGELHRTEGEIGVIRCSEHLSRRCLHAEDPTAVFLHVLTVAESPLLLPFVRDSRVTALIAPNDHHARTMYFWFRHAGIHVPRDLSVLSFDNYEQFLDIPVSTVDFGFGYLGYASLHALLADIPVKSTKDGDISAQPHVVDRGSVGAPRSGAIEVDCEGALW